MKAYALSPGDPSVGIPAEAATIDFDYWPYGIGEVYEPDYREFVRESLKDTFANIFDNVDTRVVFDDEGPQL
jgi:hypothetical protein